MLHLLNGDATAAIFPDSLPGERAVWRDVLMEGPAKADAETRAAWLAPRLGVTADAYARRWRQGEATLARASEHEEVSGSSSIVSTPRASRSSSPRSAPRAPASVGSSRRHFRRCSSVGDG